MTGQDAGSLHPCTGTLSGVMLGYCFPAASSCGFSIWSSSLWQYQLPPPTTQGGSSRRGWGKSPTHAPSPCAAFSWHSSFTRSAGILHVKNLSDTPWCEESVAPSLEPCSPCSSFLLGLQGQRLALLWGSSLVALFPDRSHSQKHLELHFLIEIPFVQTLPIKLVLHF